MESRWVATIIQSPLFFSFLSSMEMPILLSSMCSDRSVARPDDEMRKWNEGAGEGGEMDGRESEGKGKRRMVRM